MLKWILVPVGLLTALVLAAPQLVIVGLILMIVPGVILIMTPTLFVYMLATCIIRTILPLRSEVGSHFAAFLLTLGLSAAIMHGLRVPEQRHFAEAALPDVEPRQKLTIAGDVFINWPRSRTDRRDEVACDYLCTALLDTPGVTSVTRTSSSGSATFRLGPSHQGTLIIPHEPQKLLDKFREMDQAIDGQRLVVEDPSNRALQAEWALRLAVGEELRREAPLSDKDADWTISLEQQHEKGRPFIDRLEIRNKDEVVLVRRSWVRHFVYAPFFFFGFDGGSSVDGFAGTKFYIGGATVSNRPRSYDFDGAVELLRSVDIRRPTPAKDLGNRMEKALNEVLDNPVASESQLMIVPMWLAQFRFDAKAGDIAMINRILMDERIADPADLLRNAVASGTDLTPLRAGMVKRYLRAADSKAKSWYIASLARLPDGSFAQPTDAERAIWKDALVSHESALFVERMADQGPAALPELLALLDSSLPNPWHARRKVLTGIREAFKRLGREAAPAVPLILSIIEKSPSALFNTWGDRIEWLVALHIMGAQEMDLKLGLRHAKSDEVDREIQRIMQQAQKYRET